MVAVQVKFVDAGSLYVSWRWEYALDSPRVVAVPRDLVQDALDALARAVPSAQPGESAADALTRALTRGPLLDRSREIVLAEALSRALLPHKLAMELNALVEQGVRPHLRIQPSPSTAFVPWEALRVDDGERTVHHADVSVLPPASVRNAVGRRVSPYSPTGRVVGVLDPRVPGFGDASALGSVLGADAPEALVAQHGVRRDDVDRVYVESALVDAARLLYVGHVTTGEHALDARMHLSCRADVPGVAAVVGAHRPLTAADVVLRGWHVPNRVALIACESGGDNRFAEPSGLVAAMVHGGAEHVVSTRWTLPTDAGLAHLAQVTAPVLGPAVVAVDAAQAAADPIAAFGAWQRDQATRWEATGDPAYSPIVWAAFATAWAPRT